MSKKLKFQKLHRIAKKDLRDCYHNEGVFASKINFSDYWARDTFWASLGMMAIDDDEQAKKSLALFLKNQRKDGKIPRKICLDFNLIKYLGIQIPRKKPRPIFTSPIKLFFSFDDNLLLTISFCHYIEKTGDFDFAKKYFDQIALAIKFYQNKKLIRDSLLNEIGLGNWMDTVFKKGAVLYTNCLWFGALKRFEKLSQEIGKGQWQFEIKSEKVAEKIQEKFWLESKGYFADNVCRKKQIPYFDLAGNVLAIIFGIAKQKQAEKIILKADSIKKKKDFLHPINHPRYPLWKISPATFPLGIADYQNMNNWSWIEILLILAKFRSGQNKKGLKNLESFSKVVLKLDTICETYNLNGTPFDHLFWKSARPFAWSAGLLLWVLSEIEREKN